MTNLVVLALDISRNRTGWAVGSPNMTRPEWGVYEAKGIDWRKAGGIELDKWESFLVQTIAKHHVTYIAMETLIVPPNEFHYGSHIPISQMHGVVCKLAAKLKLRHGDVAISTWRLHWLGHGIAPKHITKKDERTAYLKEAAIKQAVKRNWYVIHHDEAEALGIMDYALFCLDADYAHKNGPTERRTELKAQITNFRGEDAA